MFLVRLTYWGGVINRVTGWRLSRFNVWIYRVTGGRLGDATPGARVILLTTTGRKTGRSRTVPVASWPDGDDLIVGNGAGGSPSEPQWFLNICANPNATVQAKRDTFNVRARVFTPSEQDAYIEKVAPRTMKLYDRLYRRLGPRRATLVRLTRLG